MKFVAIGKLINRIATPEDGYQSRATRTERGQSNRIAIREQRIHWHSIIQSGWRDELCTGRPRELQDCVASVAVWYGPNVLLFVCRLYGSSAAGDA